MTCVRALSSQADMALDQGIPTTSLTWNSPMKRTMTLVPLLAILTLSLGLGACNNSSSGGGGAPAGGTGGGSGSATLCNGMITYDLDMKSVSADSSASGQIAVVSIDLDNGIVQVQANYTDKTNTSYSLVLNFTGVTAAGAATLTPTSVAYTVIDAGNATVLETYISLSPGDFTCNFTALDVTGANFSFDGGAVFGGPIGGSQGMRLIEHGTGNNQTCN